jgi:hypothetical protein
MAFPATTPPVNANLARQKTFMINRNAGVFYALKALFLHLAANKGNPDLYFQNIDGLLGASDGGAADQVITDGPCTLYAVYAKKTGATATVLKLTNSTTAAATDGSQAITTSLVTAGSEQLLLYPTGYVFATGLTLATDTTVTGSTDSLKANRVDGFIIVGA